MEVGLEPAVVLHRSASASYLYKTNMVPRLIRSRVPAFNGLNRREEKTARVRDVSRSTAQRDGRRRTSAGSVHGHQSREKFAVLRVAWPQPLGRSAR